MGASFLHEGLHEPVKKHRFSDAPRLLLDATKMAVTQAVDMTLTKLKIADRPVRPKVKKRP